MDERHESKGHFLLMHTSKQTRIDTVQTASERLQSNTQVDVMITLRLGAISCEGDGPRDPQQRHPEYHGACCV
jgi:hypothetical protein